MMQVVFLEESGLTVSYLFQWVCKEIKKFKRMESLWLKQLKKIEN